MRILGAIVAGGRSRRFGPDKALADYCGRRLLDHVADRLTPQVDAVIVCGRVTDGWICVADRPGPMLGPLAGINAALHHAALEDFDAVVTVPCDTPLLPFDLVAVLRAQGPSAYVENMPIIGLWPVSLAPAFDLRLSSNDRSVRAAAMACGAIPLTITIANINHPADLTHLSNADVVKA